MTSPISFPGRGRQLSWGAAAGAAALDAGEGAMSPVSAGAGKCLVAHGVRAGRDRVVALRADLARELATRVLPRRQQVDRVGEVVARRPAEIRTRARAVVDALDAVEHAPAALRVDVLVGRDEP